MRSIVLLISSMLTLNCAGGNNISRNYEVSEFSKIDANTVASIHFLQSTDGTTSVQVSGPENSVNLVEVSVVDQTLKIRMKKSKIRSFKNVQISIVSPRLEYLYNSGVGSFSVDELTTDQLRVINEGVGDLKIAGLDAQSVRVSMSGVGNVELSGKVVNAHLRAEGVGNLRAENLQSEVVDAVTGGVGNLSCWATKSLNAVSSGVGNIRYKGNPANKSLQKQGVGNIKEIKNSR